MRRAAALAAAGVWLVLSAAPSGAQATQATPSPPVPAWDSPTRCSDGPSGGSGLDPANAGAAVGGGMGGGGGGSWGGSSTGATGALTGRGAPDPGTLVGGGTSRDDEEDAEDSGLCSGLLSAFAPEQYGPYSTGNYDLGYSEGVNCVTSCMWRRVNGPVMNGLNGIGNWFVAVGLDIVNFSRTFGLAHLLAPVATEIGDNYRSQVIEPMGLGRFCLVITAGYASYLAFTGKLLRGGAEFAQSLVILALGVTLLADPGQWLVGAMDASSAFGTTIAAASTGQDPSDINAGTKVSDGMAKGIHQAFVERPYEVLDWGPNFPSSPACRDVANAALASGPWGPSAKPRDAMRKAGCYQEASFNRDPGWDRVAGAGLLMLGQVILMVLLILGALTFLAAQMAVLAAIAISAFAFPMGALPSWARGVFWWWCGFAAAAMVGMVLFAVLLSWVLAAVLAVLSHTGSLGLLKQMLCVDLVCVVGLVKRKAVMRSGRRAVSNVTSRLSAGAAAGVGAAAGAGLGMRAYRTYRMGTMVNRSWSRHQSNSASRSAERDARAAEWDTESLPAPLARRVTVPSHRNPQPSANGNGHHPPERPVTYDDWAKVMNGTGNGTNGHGSGNGWDRWEAAGQRERAGDHVLEDALAP